MMHFIQRKNTGRHGVAALKLDMAKAYDRLEWPYLQNVLLALGFSNTWVNLIMLCVTTVRYQISLDNELLGPIIPSRGMRQGDPCPLIYSFCALKACLDSFITRKRVVPYTAVVSTAGARL